jgi:hypothetical protein
MDRPRRVLIPTVAAVWWTTVILLLALPSVSAPPTPTCPVDAQWGAGCPVIDANIDDDHVDIDASNDRPGTPTSSPSAPPRTRPSPGPSDAIDPMPGVAPADPPFWEPWEIVEPVTIEDLASFRPETGTTHMEPNGWSIAGLPTNFWIDTRTHTLTGPLLDRTAVVQFTPVAARFSYGDNTPTVRTSLGGSWTTSGVAEFGPTSTSHIYRGTGTFTVTPRVDFTVRYSYDGGEWIPIEGILTATGDALTAAVVRAKTVLVTDDCTRTPEAPGC